jgi:antibiotic biosynthesis monooxygenase (ABM) superfamily enzyme
MENDPVVLMVGLRCPDEIRKKFIDWYDEHIDLMFKHPGLKLATRYESIKDDETIPNFITCYEFEDDKAFEDYTNSPERKAALKQIDDWWPGGTLYERKFYAGYKATKTWKR